MMIAEKPKIITRSLKNGKTTTVPGAPEAGLLASSFEKIINNKKQRLQIKVNLEKNEIIFMCIFFIVFIYHMDPIAIGFRIKIFIAIGISCSKIFMLHFIK